MTSDERAVPVDPKARRGAIALRLRAAREMAGLSQGQVARLMDLHRPAISEAEAGRRRVTAEEMAEFAEHYGVSVAWLSGTGPEAVEADDARIQLAARELGKLKREDLDRILHLLAALRTPTRSAP
jgi:transcriptional regulator with XRE-family HTH domain